MGISDIVLYGDPILRANAEEIGDFNDDIKDLIEGMCVTLVEAHGYGLAGPQVGVSKRIFVYDIGEGPHALVNPKILKSSGEEIATEGCLSIPGLQGDVARAERVVVIGIDESGEKVKIKAQGLLARVFQHEIDHLDGIVFVDKADPETLETIPIDDDEESEG